MIEKLDPDSTSPKTAREIKKRARKLNRCDVLPCWVVNLAHGSNNVSPPLTSKNAITIPITPGSDAFLDVHQTLDAKSAEHEIPVPVLRTVFKRGLREFATLQTAPPMTAVQYAHGRVNTFINLFYGDPVARAEDSDLVNVAYRARQALS